MNIQGLIERVKDVIYPNVVKGIDAQEHQALIIELLEVYNDGKANTEHKHSIDDIDDLREVVEDIESSVKKDIEDIKMNNSVLKKELDATKEALKIVSSGDEVIKSKGNPILLPTNTQSSIANSYQVNGLTVENMVRNGNFKNGTSNIFVTGEASHIDGGRFLITGSKGAISSIFRVNKDDLIYFGAKVKEKIEGMFLFYNTAPKQDVEVGYNSVIFKTTTFPTEPRTQIGFYQKTDNSGEVEIDYFLAINLTKMFGKGDEPSKEWCDMHLANYIDGIKSVNATQRIKAVGKNLVKNGAAEKGLSHWEFLGNPKVEIVDSGFKVTRTSGGYADGIRQRIYLHSGEYYIGFKKVDNSSHGTSTILELRYTDESIKKSVVISTHQVGYTKREKIVIENSDLYYIDFRQIGKNNSYLHITDVYISAVNDNYISYQESNLHINSDVELRSVGNVNDVIREGELIRRIGVIDNTILTGNITVSDVDGGVNIVYRGMLDDFKTYPFEVNPIINIQGVKYLYDTVGINLFYYERLAVTIFLSNDKFNQFQGEGNYDKARSLLDVLKIYTYLNNPTVTPIQTSGQLVLKPNGTLFSEPIKMGAEVYDGGIKTSLPIIEVESLAKFDMETGNDVEIDKSKAVIDKDKLTHPDLKDGDMVFLEYLYDDSPIIPELEVESFNSDKVLEDKTTGDLYSWGIEVDNGEVKLVSNKVANKIEEE